MPGHEMKRPNVLVILTDDQGAWAMGCAGNREIRTPNLDRLARSGLRFNNFFCASPVCSPARASLLTGRIPSQHGIHDWLRAGNTTIEPDRGGVLIEYLRGQIAYTDVLAANGYICGLSGKWHLGDAHHAQKGFTFWETHAMGGSAYYGAPLIRNGEVYREPRYVTDVITDNALRFLDAQHDASRPFNLSVHYTAPHSPWNRHDHPANLYDNYYDNCAFDSVPDLELHPWQVVELIDRDRSNRRGILSGYYAAVTAMDENVGRILDRLESLGLKENTLVLFTGDNGMNMGHHGIYGKGNGTYPMNMYDTSVKVPCIISCPGHVPEGIVSDDLISHYDVFPTLLDYLKLQAPELPRLPGRSFARLLDGRPFDGSESVVIGDEYGPVRMIRTREWKYVHRYPSGPHELYDMVNDPDEDYNLIESGVPHARADEMRSALEDWFARYADPAVDGRREAVTGLGQLGLAGSLDNYAGPPRLLNP